MRNKKLSYIVQYSLVTTFEIKYAESIIFNNELFNQTFQIMKIKQGNFSSDIQQAYSFCYDILVKVSRTFAISIYRLNEKLRWGVLIAYLLCRIVDTIEDDNKLPQETKKKLFELFNKILRANKIKKEYIDEFQKIASKYLKPQHKDYLILTQNIEKVMAIFFALPIEQQKPIKKWTLQMSKGMQEITELYPKGVQIKTLKEYYQYCFYVAGTVGYMLTDLWQPDNKLLQESSQDFANGLQSVNILKDIANDYYKEKNIYLPEELFKKHKTTQKTICNKKKAPLNQKVIEELIDYTQANLNNAFDNYYCKISRRNLSYFSVRHFCIVPLFYAFATLNLIKKKDYFFLEKKTIKISKQKVKALFVLSYLAIFSNKLSKLVIRYFC